MQYLYYQPCVVNNFVLLSYLVFVVIICIFRFLYIYIFIFQQHSNMIFSTENGTLSTRNITTTSICDGLVLISLFRTTTTVLLLNATQYSNDPKRNRINFFFEQSVCTYGWWLNMHLQLLSADLLYVSFYSHSNS